MPKVAKATGPTRHQTGSEFKNPLTLSIMITFGRDIQEHFKVLEITLQDELYLNLVPQSADYSSIHLRRLSS